MAEQQDNTPTPDENSVPEQNKQTGKDLPTKDQQQKSTDSPPEMIAGWPVSYTHLTLPTNREV